MCETFEAVLVDVKSHNRRSVWKTLSDGFQWKQWDRVQGSTVRPPGVWGASSQLRTPPHRTSSQRAAPQRTVAVGGACAPPAGTQDAQPIEEFVTPENAARPCARTQRRRPTWSRARWREASESKMRILTHFFPTWHFCWAAEEAAEPQLSVSEPAVFISRGRRKITTAAAAAAATTGAARQVTRIGSALTSPQSNPSYSTFHLPKTWSHVLRFGLTGPRMGLRGRRIKREMRVNAAPTSWSWCAAQVSIRDSSRTTADWGFS